MKSVQLNKSDEPIQEGYYQSVDGRFWIVLSVRKTLYGHVVICRVTESGRELGGEFMALMIDFQTAMLKGGDVSEYGHHEMFNCTLDDIEGLKEGGMKIEWLCEEAGIMPATIYAKLKRRRDGKQSELSLQQSVSLAHVLKKHRDRVTEILQRNVLA